MTATPTVTEPETTTRRSIDPPGAGAASRPNPLVPIVVIGVYLFLGVAAFWPVLPGISQRVPGGGISNHDYILSAWYLGWIPHALTHGLNPFFSHAMFAPTGVNLAQNTSSPLLGLVASPLTLAFGPLVADNLLLVLAMPASAAAAFIVLRKWNVWWVAAALGGLIYGFSPFMLTQSLAHVNFIFVPLPPFIALTVASILQRRGNQLRLGLQLGALVVAQYLIMQEVLATVALFVALAVLCVAIRYRTEIPQIARSISRAVLVALIVIAVVLAYPVGMLIFGPQHFAGSTLPSQNPFHNDLLSFVLPGFAPNGSDPVEAGGYIGSLLLIVTAVLVWRARRVPRVQLTAVLFGAAVLFSLGPYLSVDRHLTHVPLPFVLLSPFSLVSNILPSRLSFEVDAFLAGLVAFGLDDVRRRPEWRRGSAPHAQPGHSRRGPVVAASLALATLAGVIVAMVPSWPGSSPDTPVALPTALIRSIPSGDPIAITYPYDTQFDMRPMLWQAEDKYQFRLDGGYAYHPNPIWGRSVFPSAMQPPGLQAFLTDLDNGPFTYGPPPLPSQLVAKTREALAENDIRLVIVDRSVPGSAAVMQLFRETLGPPELSAGDFSLWSSRQVPLGESSTASGT